MIDFLPHYRLLRFLLWGSLFLVVCACASGANYAKQIEGFRYGQFERLQLPADIPKYTVDDRRTSPRVIYNFNERMSLTPSDYIRSGLAGMLGGPAIDGKDDTRELRFGIREFRLERNNETRNAALSSNLQIELELLVDGQVVYTSLVKAKDTFELIGPRNGLVSEAQDVLDKSFYQVLKKIFYDPALVAALKQKPQVIAQAQPVSSPQTVAQSQPKPIDKPKADDHADDVAVIIGNRDYQMNNQKIPNVDFALNDAERMRRFVIDTLGYREGNVILVKNATQASLVSLFGNERTARGKLSGWLKADRSRVFVYYSGHGAPSLADGQGYLLPVDADPNTIELNGYALELLYRNLAQLPARQVTVVLDACFSGSSQKGAVISNASPAILKVVDTKAVLPNATVITATSVSEVASWDESAQMGLFTRQFLEGATGKADQDGFGNGDGQVTVAELRNYLTSEVSYLARRLYLREQHPQVVGRDEQVIAGVR